MGPRAANSIEHWMFTKLYALTDAWDGTNAFPHYQKLYSQVNHIWINRKGQPILSSMERPYPGGTTLVIMVASEPGKYDFCQYLAITHSFLVDKQ
ncbi:Uncharacterized protein APZ42_013862 [Daphnia magna]|uniref:Uncharacterized protein n=1 Tax=Daphnia magna TaxID=35525 RepID=A0A162QH12_9CRUS|nr:Uncharacterized protein APZ42_013862 [Daphnia magna]